MEVKASGHRGKVKAKKVIKMVKRYINGKPMLKDERP